MFLRNVGWLFSTNYMALYRRRYHFSSATLTEVFRGFPQSLQANAGIAPRYCHHRFLSNPIQFINRLPFLPSYATLSAMLKMQQKPHK
jgi:YHS domain-containing protein